MAKFLYERGEEINGIFFGGRFVQGCAKKTIGTTGMRVSVMRKAKRDTNPHMNTISQGGRRGIAEDFIYSND
jgi:hypothetical protein